MIFRGMTHWRLKPIIMLSTVEFIDAFNLGAVYSTRKYELYIWVHKENVLETFQVIFAICVLPEFSIASIISLSLINSLPIVKLAMQFNCYRKICRNATRNIATISTESIFKQILIALIANLFFGCSFGLFLWQHSNHSNSSLVMITIYVLLSQGTFLLRPSWDRSSSDRQVQRILFILCNLKVKNVCKSKIFTIIANVH